MKKNKKQNSIMRFWPVGLLVVVLLGVFLWGATPFGQPEIAAVQGLPLEVSVTEVYEAWGMDGYILDVRELSEWNTAHIPGANLIPLGELENRLAEVPQEEPVYVVCRSGNRSAVARDILLDAGFEQVTSMAGGMNQWISRDYEWVAGP
jgi:rhodanese-related sulfurtransferase